MGSGLGQGVGGAGVSGSPAAKSRTVQGIASPANGQAIWLRPVWPTVHHNSFCGARAGKGEAGLFLAEYFLTGRKLHMYLSY